VDLRTYRGPTEEHLLSVSTSVLTNTNLYKMTSSVVQFRFSCAISASLGGLAVLTTAMSMAGGGIMTFNGGSISTILFALVDNVG